MLKTVQNFFYHTMQPRNPSQWRPFLAVYYLTYTCDFRCPYCSDGAGRPYHQLSSPILDGPQVIALLKIIRRNCESLVITGGEPLKHPDVAYILKHLNDLHFDRVIFTTIGAGISRVLPQVASSVTHLVFSLDTMAPDKADRWLGAGPGMLNQLLSEIDQTHHFPSRPFEIDISSVATPSNLPDLYEVNDYCRQRGFLHAVCPQLVGVKPHPALRDNPDYQKLFNFLIERKKQGQMINGTIDYLEHMRDLRKFSCRPSTVLAVSPVGDVFFPCLELGFVAGNLLQQENLQIMRQEALSKFGREPNCDNRCHSACALGFSQILNNPLSLIQEVGCMLKGRLKKRLNRSTQTD